MNITTGLQVVPWLLLAGLLSAGLALAAPLEPEPARTVHAKVDALRLQSLDTSGAQFVLQVSATSPATMTLQKIVFSHVSVNGVPVHVADALGPLTLTPGDSAQPLPLLEAGLTFRELSTLDPVREAVREGVARVHATIMARLELNLFQKILLRSSGAWITMEVDQSIPVELPGGEVGRLASLAALTAAQPAWTLGQAGLEWRRQQSVLARQAAAVSGSLVAIECRYELVAAQTGEVAAVHKQFLGLLVDRNRILAPAEAIEPWNFDLSIAEALQHHAVTLRTDSVELLARFPGEKDVPGRSLSSRRGELRVWRNKGASHLIVSPKDRQRYHLKLRGTDENAALLEFSGQPGAVPETSELSSGSDWQPAALFHLEQTETGPFVRVWPTQVRKEYNNRLRLRDTVDASFTGSPIYAEGGVVGIVQDESSGATISNISRSARK